VSAVEVTRVPQDVVNEYLSTETTRIYKKKCRDEGCGEVREGIIHCYAWGGRGHLWLAHRDLIVGEWKRLI
jgi:hypothetical protein